MRYLIYCPQSHMWWQAGEWKHNKQYATRYRPGEAEKVIALRPRSFVAGVEVVEDV